MHLQIHPQWLRLDAVALVQDYAQHPVLVHAKMAVPQVVLVLVVADAKVDAKVDVPNNVGTTVQDSVQEVAEVIVVEVVEQSVLVIV